ncbi:hypothetical protein DFQ01_105259 [Paenibacillus cellulosilyticus]|uniref:Uncharacterized protein n=1 Tax=Paenibacillus cellulosilyticus TaxID=375489 RepID=A0A2V2YZI1_9BACL|nr:hypothetical protein DFQ01_105259 [Paenibacillus cellulosilyticus]
MVGRLETMVERIGACPYLTPLFTRLLPKPGFLPTQTLPAREGPRVSNPWTPEGGTWDGKRRGYANAWRESRDPLGQSLLVARDN